MLVSGSSSGVVSVNPGRRNATLLLIVRKAVRFWLSLPVWAALGVVCSGAGAAVEPSSVVVLYNVNSPDGIEIANYYAQVHPGVRLLGLQNVGTSEQVTQDVYLDVIRPQVLAGIDPGTEVIVTTKGLPLRILNTLPNPGTYPGWRGERYGMSIPNDWWKPYSSLESELTRIDRIGSAEQMGDQSFLLSPSAFPFEDYHPAANPYYGRRAAFDRNDPANEGIRLTARLDGFNVIDVIASIDRAQRSYLMPAGQYVVVDDDPDAPGAKADRMPQLVNDVLVPAGQDYLFDSGRQDITTAPGSVIGYVSHGSQAAGAGFIDRLTFDLAPGALLHTWESFNAYSFTEGYNLYGQGLAGEWLANGGTAALGHVQEPKASTTSVANEDILFDMLLRGYTLAEAAWSATAQLSFVNTVVGDPLMAFRPWVVADANLDGVVNFEDLNAVLANWNTQERAYDTQAGELTGDGFVGLDDLNAVFENWKTLGSSLPGSAGSVPEPRGAAVLVICGGLLWTRRGPSDRALCAAVPR
jgi:uncharacterized protein (TIGR03790 family)